MPNTMPSEDQNCLNHWQTVDLSTAGDGEANASSNNRQCIYQFVRATYRAAVRRKRRDYSTAWLSISLSSSCRFFCCRAYCNPSQLVDMDKGIKSRCDECEQQDAMNAQTQELQRSRRKIATFIHHPVATKYRRATNYMINKQL